MQPRAALGYLFGAMAGAFAACGLSAEGIAEECAQGVEACDRDAAAELGHNEIVGWEGADGRGFAIVALRDPDERVEIRRRIDVTLDVARPHASVVAAVEGHGLSRTARAFSLVATGDWVT